MPDALPSPSPSPEVAVEEIAALQASPQPADESVVEEVAIAEVDQSAEAVSAAAAVAAAPTADPLSTFIVVGTSAPGSDHHSWQQRGADPLAGVCVRGGQSWSSAHCLRCAPSGSTWPARAATRPRP